MTENGLKHFLLLGNGGGGTTFTQKALMAHSKIRCMFEEKGPRVHNPSSELEHYIRLRDEADKEGITWGNKIPVEQFKNREYTDDDILRFNEHFFIVWLRRRWSRYYKPNSASYEYYRNFWEWADRLYWQFREERPDNIIQVSWEDLLLRPRIELTRIVSTLGLEFEEAMAYQDIRLDRV